MNNNPAPIKIDEDIFSSKYEMKINDENYSIQLILNSLELIVNIQNKSLISSFYKISFTLEQLKKFAKSFNCYGSIKDIYFCIKSILDEGKGKLIKENDNIILSIPIFLPTGKKELINFQTPKIEKDDIIQTLNQKINNLENLIFTLKENVKNQDILMKNTIKRLEILEEKEKKKEVEKKEEVRFKEINKSSICKKNEISFFIKEFQKHEKFQNKKIDFKLLYKATKDSDKINIFHNKCDYKNSVLLLIKTSINKRFGGYTEIGFNNNTNEQKDDNAFVFSLDKMKIYNIKKGEIAIYCQSNLYGFKNTIYLYNNLLSEKKNRNIGGEDNYPCKVNELNGEEFFLVSEIEVYQIVGN